MTVVHIAVTFLLNAVWQVCLLAAVTHVCSWSLRRTAAWIRHWLWVFALFASALLPLLSFTAEPGRGLLQAARWKQMDAIRQRVGDSLWLNGEGETGTGRAREALDPRPAEAALLIFYSLFAAYRVGQLLLRWRKTQRMIAASTTEGISDRIIATAEECRMLLSARPVSVLSSTISSVPFTAGIVTPVVVLPQRWLETVSDIELRAALAHEMAHVRRRDFLLNLLYEVISVPVSFHPCLWWIKRQIERTRETACDETAAHCLGSSTGYARALVNLAGTLPQPSLAAAATGPALGVFDGNNLEERIMQLLDRTPRLNIRAAGAILAFSILILLATCVTGYNFALAAGHSDASNSVTSRDISGVWTGQLSEKMADGKVGHGSLFLRLQQNGDHVSGVAGDTEATTSPIENAVLSEKHLTFSAGANGGPKGNVLWTVELDVNGDAMEGKGHAIRSNDNHSWDVEIKLERNK